MPYRRTYFKENTPFHIVSRALVDIFRQEDDCYRFIFHFWASNLGRRGFNVKSRDAVKAGQALLRGEEIPPKFIVKEHDPLVYLLDFSLVVNHYHFFLLPNGENVVPTLMQKLNNSLAQSFNLIHNRKDAVFGCRYGGVAVETDFQAAAVTRYVSIINSLDVFQPGWREHGLRNPAEALTFLNNYKFSSFPDRAGKRSAKILAPADILKKYTFIGNPDNKKEFREFTKEFLRERKSTPPYFLE